MHILEQRKNFKKNLLRDQEIYYASSEALKKEKIEKIIDVLPRGIEPLEDTLLNGNNEQRKGMEVVDELSSMKLEIEKPQKTQIDITKDTS